MIKLYLFIYLFIYESQNSRKIYEALKTEQNKTWKGFFFSFCLLNLPRYSYYHGLSSAVTENYAPYNFSQLYQGTWKHNLLFAPCKGIRKVLLVGWGILDFGIWNAAQGIRNPTNDWKPECKFQYLKSTAWKYWLTSPHMKRYYVLLQLTKQYISTIGKALLRKSDFLYIFHSNYILLCFGSAIYYSWIQNKVRTKHFLESISCHYRVFSMSRNENKK